MKRSSRDDYLRRIDRVVDRLSASIANAQALPSIHELAADAYFSEFHFMRIYRALAGETLGTTIQRLRLQRALHLLTQTHAPISEIAGQVGYETPQAFAKAFRQAFGMAPSDARDQPESHAATLEGLKFKAAVAKASPTICVEVVQLEPFRVAVLRKHGDYADLDEAYAMLFKWVADQGELDSVEGIWGIPYQDRRDTPAAESVFDCCLATAGSLDGSGNVQMTQIGGGCYLRYRHVGNYSLLDDMHDVLLSDVLPASGHALREAPILHRFLNDPETVSEAELETEIYIPIV